LNADVQLPITDCRLPTEKGRWVGVSSNRQSSIVNHQFVVGLVLLAVVFLAGCRTDMHVQPRHNPLGASTFFGDGRAARPLVPGTVARGELRLDQHLYEGKVNGQPAITFPFPITRQDLERGQERFNIYCSPCHGRVGDGNGMIVMRGLRRPPSYHIDRLRNAPLGHFFDVITNGYGAMYSYASRIPVEDRWRIIGYVRALQLSQQAKFADLPEKDRQMLEGSKTP